MTDDSYLVTSGELDNTLMIWSYKGPGSNDSPTNRSSGNGKNYRDADVNDDLERESTYRKIS